MTDRRRQTKRTTGRTDAPLRAFVRHAPIRIAMFDRKMNYIAVSDRWIADYGGGRTDLIGLCHYELFPELPRWWKDVHDQALAGETVEQAEDLWIQPDGTKVWLSWAVLPWRDEGGEIGGIIITADDITKRKQTEIALRESEQRYAAIFDAAPFAIALSRASDRVIVGANAAFLKMFEFELHELIGKNAIELGISAPGEQERVVADLEAHGRVRDLEITRKTKSGARRVLILNLDWCTIAGERHMLTNVRDVTEIKRGREATVLYEKAKELDRLKTELFANVSHELRTPLALILGPTERVLASASIDIETRRQLEVVRRNAQTLSRHVEDLLEVARLDAGNVQPRYGDIDLAWLVGFVASHFQLLAADHAIRLVVEAGDALVAQIDRDMVQRILVNIIGNAFRFTPDRGTIRITLRPDSSRFAIEIADSGPGVPADKREEIFNRFARLESTARPYGGTGLGLAIVKELVALHGGSVTVGDAPEGGALFRVELPVKAPPGAVMAPAGMEPSAIDLSSITETLREPAPTPTVDSSRGQLVLVVEDNREMNAFVCDCLREAGLRVETAFDGAEGIAKAIELRPDLVLTDIMMPGTTGDQLIHALRQRRELDAMPIVVLSAKADAELRVRLLREGAQDWLMKPFSTNELDARVGNLLARKRAEQHASSLQRQLEDVMEASKAVSEAVTNLPETSVLAVLKTIALEAQAFTSATYAAVGIGRDPEVPFAPWVHVGLEPAEAAAIGDRPPRPIGTLGAACREGTMRLRDLRTHPGFQGYPAHHPQMTSFLGVPIRYRDQPVGTLYLANKRDAPEFTEQDQHVIEMLAARVGVAIETARLYSGVGKERSWLQAVIDQMPEAVVLMDESGRVTAQNRLALELGSEVHARDPFGNPLTLELRDAKGTPLSPEQYPNVRAIRARETTYSRDLLVTRTDGKAVPMLVSAAPVLASDGELAGATMVLQDVSTLKALERLREEWASVVAHDLLQPVNAITLLSDLLLAGTLDSKARERVERVRRLSNQLGQMVGDLADAAQLEAQRLRIKHDVLDVAALVREATELVPGVASRAEVSTPADHPVLIDGDANRLFQVFTNLLSNAVKYGAPQTPIVVEVAESSGAAHISVTNRGSGIAAEELPLVFERFVRTREAAAGQQTGSGLGLYIAKGLVEAHGGRIWAESVRDASTTFHITIPLLKPDAQVDAARSSQ